MNSQFCHLKHQVMVYDTILHKHRRKLHRLAALAFEADPCKGRCPLYLSWSKEQIAFHRFQVVRSGAAGQARLEKTITPDDLLAACHSTLAVVVQNCNNGHLPEALDKQVPATTPLPSARNHCARSPGSFVQVHS